MHKEHKDEVEVDDELAGELVVEKLAHEIVGIGRREFKRRDLAVAIRINLEQRRIGDLGTQKRVPWVGKRDILIAKSVLGVVEVEVEGVSARCRF